MQIESYSCNMHKYIPRAIEADLRHSLRVFPAVVLLGPRQCGKSTLVKKISNSKASTAPLYLDLEDPREAAKLSDPFLFLEHNKKAQITFDEFQTQPHLFEVLKSHIDKNRRNGAFILLGSAALDLVQKSSETLAGRVGYLELTPFTHSEVKVDTKKDLKKHWMRGGYPDSYLAKTDADSSLWRESFIKTYLERDFHMMGFDLNPIQLRRFFTMCAHWHGQILNQSKLGESLGVSHTSIKKYLHLFEHTYTLRILAPWYKNSKKRLVKSPKMYIRDSGLFHQLLNIQNFNELLSHPGIGSSWEGYVIENILSSLKGWKASFFRDSNGSEMDLILEKGKKIIAVECKASSVPTVEAGFWTALKAVNASEAWIISPIEDSYDLKKNIHVSGLKQFLQTYA